MWPADLHECPADLHECPAVIREGPALLPVDRRRLPLGPRPFSCGPPSRRRPRAPRRPTTSSPSAAVPLPNQDDVLLPAGRFPNRRPGTAADSSTAVDSAATASADSSAAPARHRRLISSPLATHGGGMGPAAQRRPPQLGWVFFSKCNYVCIIFNHGSWIVDK
jgi:hypothetical protein